VTTVITRERRDAAVRRVRLLNNVTIGWNVVEGVLAVTAGIIAGSISLIGFGLDSGVEVSTSVVLALRLARERRDGCRQEDDRRATRLIALCFAGLGVYVGVEASRQLIQQHPPDVSVLGIGIAAASVVVMPILARAKRRLGPVLGSQAVVSESRQTELCAWLSGVVWGMARLATGWLRVRSICRSATEVPECVKLEVERLFSKPVTTSSAQLKCTDTFATPCTVGILRPVILLPRGLCVEARRIELQSALAHEREHITGKDLQWNFILHLVTSLLWFHPLAWLLRIIDGRPTVADAHVIRLKIVVHQAMVVGDAFAQ
jgi:hypothetical protein